MADPSLQWEEAQAPNLFSNDSGLQLPDYDSLRGANRAKAFSDWVQMLPVCGKDATVKGRTAVSVSPPEDAQALIEEQLESNQWPDDLPTITDVRSITDQCPFTAGTHLKNFQKETETGVWKVKLDDAGTVVVFRLPLAMDSEGNLHLFAGAAGDEDAVDKWYSIRNETGTSRIELRPGLFKAFSSVGGIGLKEGPDLKAVPTVHPKTEEFLGQVSGFFENPDPYARFGQAGLKSWLMYGTYGTGKSTLIAEMARNMKEERAVVFVSDAEPMKVIGRIAAEQEVPTIIVASEAEEVLNDADGKAPSHESDSTGASSTTLNFLSGAAQPRNPAGTALVMVTNKPGRIPRRIRKRTGRINQLIRVGPISGDYAVECARLYLPDSNTVTDDTIKEVVETTGSSEGLVGDDIREIAIQSAPIAISLGREEVGDECFRKAAEGMSEDLREIENFSLEESEAHDFSESGNTGFDPGR
jgi:hypothetical protein